MRIDRSPRRWLIPKVALVFLALAASLATAQTGPVQYGYDELGRLVIVVDGAGNTATYNYDAVGNLLSIQRIDPNQLGPIAITAITPTQGKVGSAVSILGKGFGATPAQNTVSFNGGVATVTSASPAGLRVTVPSTAQDGPISVTAPAGSATSAQSFRVIGTLTITPTDPISAGGSRQFTATAPGGSTPPVIWAVNDVVGGSASVGTISAGGLYTTPAYMAQQTVVTIGATDQSDPTARGALSITVVPRRFATAAQGVSVRFAQPGVSNSLQAAVSAVVGGTSVNKSVQASVSAVVGGGITISKSVQASVSAVVVGGITVSKSAQASVSAVIGGEPAASAVSVVSVSLAPVITGVSPAAGARGATGLSVTLTGAGFTGATQATFLRNNAADTSITSSLVSVSADGAQATLSLSIAGGAVTGARVIQITTPSGASTVVGTGANVFTVQ